MTRVLDRMTSAGHEQVVYVSDATVGLRAIIAVHSTALGPSLGGIRFWHYDDEDDALVDVLRLSRAMTLKAAAAGLHQGGGKAVVLWDAPGDERDAAFLRVLGQAIDELGGRYIAAEDVGATPADMDGIARETRWVTGGAGPGGSGDPSPFTAVGVVAAMRAALRELGEEPKLSDRRVLVQGAGHVGAHLTRLLVDAGAAVTVADVRSDRVRSLEREHGVEVASVDGALELECDILAPCALGAVLTESLVPRLRCQAVVGAANNQLATPEVDDALAARGILYAPDFVANAGGILNLAEEFVGYDADRALARTEGIEDTMSRVLALAKELGVPPGRAAETMAERRIEAEGSGHRWEPGDPTAWTGGKPLVTLRPGIENPARVGSSSPLAATETTQREGRGSAV